MRIFLHTQLGIFLLYGIISGMAISCVINYKCKEAEIRATAAVLMQLSPASLSDIAI